MGPSIQEELEKAAFRLFKESVQFEAASRTDRGVHAYGQIVQFFLKEKTDLPIQRALNAILPSDIRILSVEETPSHFHPTLDAKGKTYQYNIWNHFIQNPIERHLQWHYPYPMDISLMKQAAQMLIGTHDFSSFTTKPVDDPIRTLFQIEIIHNAPSIQIQMTGDRFLYKMARRIAGTLANIGSKKLDLSLLPQILSTPSRSLAGVTAPPHGLFLKKVHF